MQSHKNCKCGCKNTHTQNTYYNAAFWAGCVGRGHCLTLSHLLSTLPALLWDTARCRENESEKERHTVPVKKGWICTLWQQNSIKNNRDQQGWYFVKTVRRICNAAWESRRWWLWITATSTVPTKCHHHQFYFKVQNWRLQCCNRCSITTGRVLYCRGYQPFVT